jgi:S1-C subfamily serine protease
MGVRMGAGAAGLAGRWREFLVVSVASGLGWLVAMGAAPAAEAAGPGPLGHHAVVRNGNTVGSAFALADGLAVTNAHVLAGRAPGEAVALSASAPGAARVRARIVAISVAMDLGVLAVPEGFLAPVGGDAEGHEGLVVFAAGIDAGGGSASGRRYEVAGHVVSAEAQISSFGPGLVALLPGARPGFSGGPVLDGAGRLVGMLTAIRPAQQARPRAAAAAPGAAGAAAQEAYVLRAGALRAEATRLAAEAVRRDAIRRDAIVGVPRWE